jgi:hypothetical protein
MPTPDYRIGSVIEYRPFGGGLRRVRVTEKEDDIKNGRPGFAGQLIPVSASGVPSDPDEDDAFSGVWGYDRQIVRVLAP